MSKQNEGINFCLKMASSTMKCRNVYESRYTWSKKKYRRKKINKNKNIKHMGTVESRWHMVGKLY